jgi:hypothetical protein
VGCNPVDGFDQQVDQAVGERPATQMRERRESGHPQWFGMSAQFIRRFDREPLAIALDLVRPCPVEEIGRQFQFADQIELGQFGLQTVDARPARIGPQERQDRRNMAVRLFTRGNRWFCRDRFEQGVEQAPCRRWQSSMDIAAEALVMSVETSANNALDPISAGGSILRPRQRCSSAPVKWAMSRLSATA